MLYASEWPPYTYFLHLFFTFCGLQLLPENIHELADGKLHISATDVYTGKNIEVYILMQKTIFMP